MSKMSEKIFVNQLFIEANSDYSCLISQKIGVTASTLFHHWYMESLNIVNVLVSWKKIILFINFFKICRRIFASEIIRQCHLHPLTSDCSLVSTCCYQSLKHFKFSLVCGLVWAWSHLVTP